MELEDFGASFTPGFTLSVEERAALEVQMAKRKADEKLHSIKFWGRVAGTTADYLVCCGTISTLEKPSRKWYYATTKSLSLQQMPEMTDAFTKLAAGMKGRFLGNPAKLLGPDADAAEEDGVDADGNPLPKAVKFSEAHRLGYSVSTIESATGVVPKGAYVVTPTHHIVADPLFAGLHGSEATSLGSYLHFRPSQHPVRAHALYKAGAVPITEFLDPVSEDKPKGCWTVRLDAGAGLVELRSLSWPGYFFYHSVGTAKYGGVYIGDGRPNTDLQFIM